MTRDRRLVAGLDLGSTKTCAVIAEVVGDLPRLPLAKVLGVGLAKNSGVRRGMVRDIDETKRSVVAALRDAERMAGVVVKDVTCGIAGEHVSARTSTGVVALTGEEVAPSDVGRVNEVARAVSLGRDNELLHDIPQEYVVDQQRGIVDPVGMTGTRLEVEMYLVTVQSTAAQNLRKAVQRAGYRVADLVLEPLAASYAVLTEDEKELGVALVEVGGGSTGVTIFHEGKIRHLASLRYAGSHVTQDLVQGLGVTQADAERLKERHGVAYGPLVDAEEMVNLPSTPSQGARQASRELLSHIIHERVDEIFQFVAREFERAGYGAGRLPAGVVLTGGTAHLPGMVELAREAFATPVRAGAPEMGISGLVDSVQAPRYAVPVGLVLYAARKLAQGAMIFELEETVTQNARMKVVGIGGGGGNALNRMVDEGLNGVEFVSVNTDAQALMNNKADVKVQIGKKLTRGLGAGARPEIGRQAIEENRDEVLHALQGADLVFVTCGMGGGTGTGASPIIAQASRDLGALTIGIVTKPFLFEGRKRMRQADMGIAEMRKHVDTMVVVPNERLLAVVGKGIPFQDALKKADEVLLHATQGISSLISVTGIVNVDFADVRTVMQNGGAAIMGTGTGRGENRAMEAVQQAISSPLLDNISIAGATGVLINITGGEDLTLGEVTQISDVVKDAAGEDAEIIFGTVNDPAMHGEIRVTVIATGFDRGKEQAESFAGARPAAGVLPFRERAGRPTPMPPPGFPKTGEPLVRRATSHAPPPPPPSEVNELEIPTFIRRQMD